MACGALVLCRLWARIPDYAAHLSEQSEAALSHGTANRLMPTALTRVPVINKFLAVIVPFFRHTASHEWVSVFPVRSLPESPCLWYGLAAHCWILSRVYKHSC